jgi:hypothetical protein
MKTLSAKLMATVDTAEATLLAVTEEESAKPALPGGWSRKQLICHIGSLDPMKLRFVAEDYLHHLNHHLSQIGISSSAPA